MTLNYKLDREDYVQHQLYTSSQSVWLKKENKKSSLIFTFIAFMLCIAFYFVGQGKWRIWLTFYFFVLGIIFLFFYPSMLKNSQRKNCERSVDEVYKNRFGQEVQVVFNSDDIETKDRNQEARFRLANIEKIIEIPNYFYLKLLTGETLIISKKSIDEPEILRDYLMKLCNHLSIDFVNDVTWTWFQK